MGDHPDLPGPDDIPKKALGKLEPLPARGGQSKLDPLPPLGGTDKKRRRRRKHVDGEGSDLPSPPAQDPLRKPPLPPIEPEAATKPKKPSQLPPLRVSSSSRHHSEEDRSSRMSSRKASEDGSGRKPKKQERDNKDKGAPPDAGESPEAVARDGDGAADTSARESKRNVVEEDNAVDVVEEMYAAPPPSRQHEVLYVEGESGHFRKVSQEEAEHNARTLGAEGEDGDHHLQAVAGGTMLKSAVDASMSFLGMVFVMCQGFLAGSTLLLFIMCYISSRSDREFLAYYSSIATHVSSTLFFLTSLSTLGAIDMYYKDKLNKFGQNPYTQLLDGLAVTFYFLSFATTVASSPMDDVMYYTNERVPRWYEEGDLQSNFVDELKIWHFCNIVRIFGGLLGWMVVCAKIRAYDLNPQYTPDEERLTQEKEALQRKRKVAGAEPAGPGWVAPPLKNNLLP
eukprot:Rmarinus@m.17005